MSFITCGGDSFFVGDVVCVTGICGGGGGIDVGKAAQAIWGGCNVAGGRGTNPL